MRSALHTALRPLMLAAAIPLRLVAASAETPRPRPAPPAEAERPAREPDSLKQHDRDLEAVRAEQRKALENEAKLKREIESIGDDRRKFNQQIIDTAARVVTVEERIAQTQERLLPLDDREESLRTSLEQRRGIIAEVMAALQRIGRHAPPALLVRPEDALASVRSAMMLGAVLPELRSAADKVSSDLRQLMTLKNEMAAERDRMRTDLTTLAEEKTRVQFLIEEKRDRRAAS